LAPGSILDRGGRINVYRDVLIDDVVIVVSENNNFISFISETEKVQPKEKKVKEMVPGEYNLFFFRSNPGAVKTAVAKDRK
jgi:hypothetical protein